MIEATCKRCNTTIHFPIHGGARGGGETQLAVALLTDHPRSCPHQGAAIHDAEGLRAAILTALAMKPGRLTGGEIVMLRTGMGLLAKQLSSLLEVRDETISRWENGHSPMEPAAEKLLRLCVGLACSENAPAVAFDPLEIIDMHLGKTTYPISMSCKGVIVIIRSKWKTEESFHWKAWW